jgi:Protein of unknown function (DUF3313)
MKRVTSLLLVAITCLIGCRARPAPSAGFNEEPSRMTLQPKDAAFQRLYLDPNHKWGGYTQLYVAPVNMHYMMTQSFWEKASEANLSKEDVQKSADQIAEYTRQAFIKAAQNDPKKHFTVVDTPTGPNTLIVETAIVQLVPSKAVLNALGFVSWIPTAVMMGGSTASGSEDQGKGLVAIEGRVRDGASGQVVGEFADRERPPTAIVDIKSLNWWAPARKVIDNWGKQFIALSNSPTGTVKSSPTFELLVW